MAYLKDKKWLIYSLITFVLFVFIQALFFKFTGSEETVIIFSTIASWMENIGLLWIAPIFKSYGGYTVGAIELLICLLFLVPSTRRLGAILGILIMSGAIFFHLFTPLGVNRIIDAQGNTDNGVLFYMACGVWLSCLLIFIFSKPPKTTRSVYR